MPDAPPISPPPKRRWFQYSLRGLMIFITVAGCAFAWLGIKLREPAELMGQPSWFPLGGEVYHSQDRLAAERILLAFKAAPRWFVDLVPATRTADEKLSESPTGSAASQGSAPSATGSGATPSPPASPPKLLNDLPIVDQGASLSLRVSPAASPDQIRFLLTLKAAERTVWRQVEHRWTNTLPLLFAFYADGTAVSHDLKAFAKSGGVSSLEKLVEQGDEKQWSLLVDLPSLGPILEQRKPRELAIVAVFSERQHEGLTGGLRLDGGVSDVQSDPPHSTIVVRSNVVRLKRSGDHWEIEPP